MDKFSRFLIMMRITFHPQFLEIYWLHSKLIKLNVFILDRSSLYMNYSVGKLSTHLKIRNYDHLKLRSRNKRHREQLKRPLHIKKIKAKNLKSTRYSLKSEDTLPFF